MPDRYDLVETNFRKLSYPEYYMVVNGFADALDVNELYNQNRPEHIVPPQRYREHITTMKQLSIGADRGDSLLQEQRHAARELADLDMYSSVSYMKTIAIHKQDPTILHSLNLPLKESHHKALRKLNPNKAAEILVELRHLRNEPGAIVILGTHVRNGGPYLINICKGEPISEESWYNPGGHHKTCTKIILRNLEPANRYYVRLRTDGPEGPGKWSQAVSIIVL
ncbi:MAG: hypothetical protein FPO08_04125 [Geobacter sp.]|nr:MAG: hypothetical protein FPO08_04125 [Geobacter sp.]